VKRALGVFAPLGPPLALLGVHALALRALYAADVMGRLLGAVSPSGWLVLLLACFYLLRLVAFFVAPGWLLVAVVRVAVALRRGRSVPESTVAKASA
jgi:hypothetical protein